MSQLKLRLAILGLLFGAAIAFMGLGISLDAQPVFAAEIDSAICDPNGDGSTADAIDKTACGISGSAGAQSTLGRILSVITQTLVLVVGGISVIVIVIGGLMYVLSTGDPSSTKRAKDAVLYAIIGLVVALVAQGLVTFVLSRI